MQGSTGKEIGRNSGVACLGERTDVNLVKNSIDEAGRVLLMMWGGGEAVGRRRQTTKWALLSAFHPCRQPPLARVWCQRKEQSFFFSTKEKSSKMLRNRVKCLDTSNHYRVPQTNVIQTTQLSTRNP